MQGSVAPRATAQIPFKEFPKNSEKNFSPPKSADHDFISADIAQHIPGAFVQQIHVQIAV